MKPIIHVEESLVAETDHDGAIGSCNGTGTFTLRNPAENTTLWTIQFSKTGGESISDLNLGELAALQGRADEVRSYRHAEQPMLKITEEIDTLPDKDNPEVCNSNHSSLAFRRSQKVLFRIKLENRYQFKLKNVKVKKVLPPFSTDADAVPGPYSQYDATSTDVTWTIEAMEPGDVISLDVFVLIEPTSRERFTTGQVIVTAESKEAFTGVTPAMRSESDDIDLPVVVGETDNPGEWDVDAKFLNNGEFDVSLEKVKVTLGGKDIIDEPEIDVDVEPGLADALWRQQTRIESADYPQVEKEYIYTVIHDVTRHSSIEITQAPRSLTVIQVEATRIFEPAEVPTYTRTALKSTTAVENIGSAEVRQLRLVEILPPYFEVTDIRAVTDKGQKTI